MHCNTLRIFLENVLFTCTLMYKNETISYDPQ